MMIRVTDYMRKYALGYLTSMTLGNVTIT